jgi:hypothetical protein
MSDWINPTTQQEPPYAYEEIRANFQNSDPAVLLAKGWRRKDPTPLPPVAEGWERLRTWWEQDPNRSEWALLKCEDGNIAERQAREAEAEAVRKASPIVYDQPIEAPLFSVLSQTSGKGVGITATDEGDIVTVIVHESPWPDRHELKAKIDAAVAKSKSAKQTAKAGISGQLQTRIENIERMLGLRA